MVTGRLWESFKLGQLELKNRLVMPAMFTRYADMEGRVTERSKNHYETRARGGVGLIIIEASYVERRGQILPNQLSISDDKFIPGMCELVDVIHRHGVAAVLQLHHGGRIARSEVGLAPPVAPSPLPIPGGEVPVELTAGEIARIVARFAQAAVRARKAGFDGVELHATNSYLIDQFISPASNKRQDSYGGEVRNRARFLIEIIEAIAKAAGRDFPVWPRINGREYGVGGGTTLEDARVTARMAQDAGAYAIHVRGAGPAAPDFFPSRTFSPATIADLAEGIKKTVTVPVIAVGMITPEAGEGLIAGGKADLVAIGRGLLADPELPQKAASGRLEQVTPCIVCMNCINDNRVPSVVGIRCSVNAALGREAEYVIAPARQSRKVLVVGGGPAGMEAARVAALRGHRVTLWEKQGRLGGQLLQAAVLPYKDRIGAFNEYLQKQLRRLNVTVEAGKEATVAAVREFSPDVVVLATGMRPLIPEIAGLDSAHAVLAGDVLEGRVEVGEEVVVIGGELVGCETAEFLAGMGKKVTVTRRGPEMALGAYLIVRPWFLGRLAKAGVTLLPGVTYHEAMPRGLVVTTREGERRILRADTLVLAAGSTPDTRLYEELKGKVPELHLAGDCVQPRSIRDAVSDGYRIGLAI